MAPSTNPWHPKTGKTKLRWIEDKKKKNGTVSVLQQKLYKAVHQAIYGSQSRELQLVYVNVSRNCQQGLYFSFNK